MLRRCVLLVRLYSTLSQSSAVGNLLSHITRVQPNHPDNHVEYALWLQEEGRKNVSGIIKALMIYILKSSIRAHAEIKS